MALTTEKYTILSSSVNAYQRKKNIKIWGMFHQFIQDLHNYDKKIGHGREFGYPIYRMKFNNSNI